jgi:hypothetical protein|tara:strand:+ start:287 stop:529 length:243 start_codon:yes stop_codon:yes gene_type:complete
MKTKITFTSALLSNFTNLIFITKINDKWQTEWELLTDKDGNTFDNIDEAIEFVRDEKMEWGIGLSTFQQAQMKNAQWSNL